MNSQGGDGFGHGHGNYGRAPGNNHMNIPPELRAQLDPQYRAALEFEELRIQREIEMQHQHEADLRRRLMEELEYRQQIQQIQNLQNHSQQNSLNELLAHNNLLGLQQHQQQQIRNNQRENDLLSSLQDEYLLQRHHHQLMMQDQMQQRLMAAELAQARSQDQYDAENVLAIMNAARNHNYAASFEEQDALRNRDELIARLSQEHRVLAAPLNEIALMDQIRNLSRQGMSTTPSNNNAPTPLNMNNTAPTPSPAPTVNDAAKTMHGRGRKSGKNEEKDPQAAAKPVRKPRATSTDKGDKKKAKTPKTPPKASPKPTPIAPVSAAAAHLSSVDDPDSKLGASSVDTGSVETQQKSERDGILEIAKMLARQKAKPDSEVDVGESEATKPPAEEKVEQKVEQQKGEKDDGENEAKEPKKRERLDDDSDGEPMPKQKRNKKTNSGEPGKEAKAKVVQELTKSGKLDGRTKKARALKKQVLAEQRILTDQEKTVINFLSGKASEAGETPVVEIEKEKEAKAKKKKEEKKKSEKDDVEDEFAANVVLKFKATSNISKNEVKVVTLWSQRGPHLVHAPSVEAKDYPYITPNLKFNLPLLPVEPELIETEEEDGQKVSLSTNVDSLIEASNILGGSEAAAKPGKSGQITPEPKDIAKAKSTVADKWWPADESIEHERKLLGGKNYGEEENTGGEDAGKGIKFTKKSLVDAKKRLQDSVEPGVLELLPCCKLFDEFRSKTGRSDVPDEPKFCFQVAHAFPDEVMVCCSECSTWRHAQCGGHYKHYSRNSADPDNAVFKPLCDRCFLERDIIKGNDLATKRLDIQRIDHLRRCNVTNAVMQQYAFSRHLQSKWPLGSVSSATQFVGHARGVQARHEKSEKLWEGLVMNLDSGKERSKDRARYRTRALERILLSVEDAESNTDIHNMILFLQNDTSKAHPVGFEKFRRNIFDPEEDPVSVVVEDSKSDDGSLLPHDVIAEDMQEAETIMDTDMEPKPTDNNPTVHTPQSEKEPKAISEVLYCARTGCQQKPRFDSIFCSDSCGVSALETDLLQSLKYAQELHPSVLRS